MSHVRQSTIMVSEAQVNTVYADIWRCLKADGALPTQRTIAQTLGYSRDAVLECVRLLRQDGRLSPTTLLPTDYREWWRENVRVETRWGLPRIIPLRRKLPKQMPMWEQG